MQIKRQGIKNAYIDVQMCVYANVRIMPLIPKPDEIKKEANGYM